MIFGHLTSNSESTYELHTNQPQSIGQMSMLRAWQNPLHMLSRFMAKESFKASIIAVFMKQR
jgi:hypothetical protein